MIFILYNIYIKLKAIYMSLHEMYKSRAYKIPLKF